MEKTNFTFFPAEVLEFFYSFLKKIKSDRQKDQHKVMCIQNIAAVNLMLLGVCVCMFLILSLNTNWTFKIKKFLLVLVLQNRVDFMQLMVDHQMSVNNNNNNNKETSSLKGKDKAARVRESCTLLSKSSFCVTAQLRLKSTEGAIMGLVLTQIFV